MSNVYVAHSNLQSGRRAASSLCVLPCPPCSADDSVDAHAVPPALCAAHMHFLMCACGSALSKLPPPAVGPLPLLLVGGHKWPGARAGERSFARE